jgi:hypothetical protein
MRRRGITAALAAVLACGAAGCTGTISGTGHVGATAPSPGGPNITITIPPLSPGTPSTSPARGAACPNVSYPAGRLAFACITDGLVPLSGDRIWPFNLTLTVEPNWVLSEAARPLEPLRGRTLRQVALDLRTRMLAAQDYGDSPGVRTESAAAATVAGVPAFILRTAFTINEQYRLDNGLHVRVERLWIVVLNAGDGQVAAWSVSVPDDVANLWPKVPGVITSIGLI